MIASPTIASKPHLWVAELDTVVSLASRFATGDLLNIPQSLEQGMHIILVDNQTPEASVRKGIYQILLSGNTPEIYEAQQPLGIWTADKYSSEAELFGQIVEFSQSYQQWLHRISQRKLSLKDAVEIAKVVMVHEQEPQRSVELGTLRMRCDQNSYDWNKLMDKLEKQFQEELQRRGIAVDPVNNDLDEKLKLELLGLLQELDPIKRVRKRAEICSFFRLSKSEVEDLLKVINKRTQHQEVKCYRLDELFTLEAEELEWLIPEMLPKGETIILGAAPKTGKTLLAIDAAFALATGESSFLGENVSQSKVLLISCDESLQSTKRKLLKRGFRSSDADFVEVLPKWTIDDLEILERKLENFRPDIVIVDSLKRITHRSNISENSAEFADNIYTLKELFNKYGASGILIHHCNKDREAMGVHKLRGSTAIAGAVWGVWQLDHIPKPDPNNKKKLIIDPKDPKRVLSIFPRDTEGQILTIEFNPENNSWEKLGLGEDKEQLTVRERILNILKSNSEGEGLSGRQILDLLNESGNKGIYTELNRMANRGLIHCLPSSQDKRVNLYSLPKSQQKSFHSGDSPSPTDTVNIVDYSSESLVNTAILNSQQNSQQLVNNSQQPEVSKQVLNNQSLDTARVTEIVNNFYSEQGERVSSKLVDCLEPSACNEQKKQTDYAFTDCLFKVNDCVSASDPYEKKYGWNGTIKEISADGSQVLVYWPEREGKAGSTSEWHEVSYLRLSTEE
ncbi:hypothetical protein NIES2109_62780 (plasmid) [Nostoc sp. HK-01]|nr:hypothetical protein NIES2109_62780 [Nostoc sp. HK-01]